MTVSSNGVIVKPHPKRERPCSLATLDRGCPRAGLADGYGQGMNGDDARLRVSPTLVIVPSDLIWRVTTSGGPGGQHANVTRSRVELSFDVESSISLGPRQRARLIEKLGAVVRVSAGDTRSQARNREIALARMGERLAEALRQDAPRRATKPGVGAKRARVDDKRRRGDVKRGRGRPREAD